MAFSEGINTRTKYRWTLRWNKIRLPFSKTFCYPFASSFKCIFKHFYGGGTPIHKIDKSKCGLVWKQAGRPRTLLIGLPFPTFSFVFSGPWDNSVEPSILQNIICWSLHQSSLLILYMGKVNTWEETLADLAWACLEWLYSMSLILPLELVGMFLSWQWWRERGREVNICMQWRYGMPI